MHQWISVPGLHKPIMGETKVVLVAKRYKTPLVALLQSLGKGDEVKQILEESSDEDSD